MAWDVKWFLMAEQKFAPEHREALLAHAQQEAARPWQRSAYALAVLDGPGIAAGGASGAATPSSASIRVRPSPWKIRLIPC